MNHNELLAERERLLAQYARARREDKTKILARLVVIDEDLKDIDSEKLTTTMNRTGKTKEVVKTKVRKKNRAENQKLESLCFQCARATADACPWIGEKKKIWTKAIESKHMADNVRNREITIYKVTDCVHFVKEARIQNAG